MRQRFFSFALFGLAIVAAAVIHTPSAQAVTVIGGSTNNGNLDRTSAVEIVSGFFLPKPQIWQNVGTRAVTGPYEDEMSSEPWSGPAPTPVTTDGLLNGAPPNGCDGPDCGVFFKPFSGNLSTGDLATGHLYQDNPATPGVQYDLSGWAGAESNFSAFIPNSVTRAVFALDFFNGNTLLSSAELDLVAAGLGSAAAPFGYRQYTVSGIAPAGSTIVRARASMIDAYGNPAGGGQAFVVDDFALEAVPEPSTMCLAGLGAVLVALSRKRSR